MKNDIKSSLLAALFVSIYTLGLISTANAALIARGSDMVYDTDLDITWLADANFAKTSGFDADGQMTWADANAWAADLTVGGGTDWRLPRALNTDGTGPCRGFNCTGSEIGHLFYTELGVTLGNSILISVDPDLNLFSNIQSDTYWFAEQDMDNTQLAWHFFLNFGLQSSGNKNGLEFAWAVHPGDIGATVIPIPLSGTILLIGLGFIGFIHRSRLR